MIPARLLITGAAGFVGHHMVRAARAAWPACHIAAAARAEDTAPNGVPGADSLPGFDLLDPASIRATVAAIRPDACIHLAALADVGASFAAPDDVWRANVDGTRALASCLRATAPDCLLVYAGSADCYGLSFLAGVALDESATLRPANPYAAAKAAADIALGEAALRGLRVVRLRPMNHVGPGQSPRFAVAAFARQIARVAAGLQAPIIRTGALDRWRDFLDVRDVCTAYAAVIDAADRLPAGAVFNLCSGTPRRLGDVAADLLRLAAIEASVQEEAQARPVDVIRACCTADLAHATFGWAPTIAWRQTLKDTLAYWNDRVMAEGRAVAAEG